jgi:hypothetical protein
MNPPVIFRMTEEERFAAIKKAEDAARASLEKLLEESSPGVSPPEAPEKRWLWVTCVLYVEENMPCYWTVNRSFSGEVEVCASHADANRRISSRRRNRTITGENSCEEESIIFSEADYESLNAAETQTPARVGQCLCCTLSRLNQS